MFVSTTATSRSKANASTARAVYGPTPGKPRSASIVSGTSPPWRATISRGGVVQVARPAGIAETLPVAQHVAERRRSARCRRRVGAAERVHLGITRRRLGLLQHHLGDEDPPRIAGRPPRQVTQPRHAPRQHCAGIDGHRTRTVAAVPPGRPVGGRRRRLARLRRPRRVGRPYADGVLARSGVPLDQPLHPRVAARRLAQAGLPPLAAVVDLHLDAGDPAGRRPGDTGDRLWPGVDRRPAARHVDARRRLDRALLGPPTRDPVAVHVLPRRQLDRASSHFVADT